MNRTGMILKGIGSFYDVLDDHDGQIYICHPRGKFRIRDGGKPMVGDRVVFQPPTLDDDGYLLDIQPRKNYLRRPPVSNIDKLMIVLSAEYPEPDLLMVDRLLCKAEQMHIESAVCVNKCDLDSTGRAGILRVQYRHLPFFEVSAETGNGIESILEFAGSSIICFAGQSGVGKSSLINCISEDDRMDTGEVSEKIGRGKHTTRRVQLLRDRADGFVVDTPGFSLLEMDRMDPRELMLLYPDFMPYHDQCRFIGCLHDKEIGCAVKEAVSDGVIDADRYERYKELLHEADENWRKRYD